MGKITPGAGVFCIYSEALEDIKSQLYNVSSLFRVGRIAACSVIPA